MPRVPDWFAALMDALQVRGANTDALMSISDADWRELLELSDPAHLTLPLAQVENSGFPRWVRDRLAHNVADNHQRFDRVRDTYKEAAAALNKAGVQHLVIKGFTQSPAFVKAPRLRMQSDIDFYCPEEQIPAARSALESIGYAADCDDYTYRNADHIPTMRRNGGWKWRGNGFDPAMPLSIELHFCLWNQRVWMIEIPEMKQLWQRRQSRKVEDLSFFALHPIDHVGYFALHILRGAISGDWIVHHALEMAAFLNDHAHDIQLWSEWEASHSEEFRSLQAIAFALAERWFSCGTHPLVRKQINALQPARRVWIHRCGGSLLERMFGQNRDWIWLHIALLQSHRDKVAVLRRSIIPPRVPRVRDTPVIMERRKASKIANQHVRYGFHIVRQASLRLFLIPRLLWQGALLRLSTFVPAE